MNVSELNSDVTNKILSAAFLREGLQINMSIDDTGPTLEFRSGADGRLIFVCVVSVESIAVWLQELALLKGQLHEIGFAVDLIRDRLS